MFKIGEFSKFTQVSVRMLRYYDKLGLFRPIEVDEFTGYRYYSAKQIPTLNKIVALRDMGFLVTDIAAVLEDDSDESVLARLEGKKKEILVAISSENEKLKKIESTIKLIGKERIIMNYEVNIKSIPSYKVVSLRDTIAAYNREGELWARLGAFLESNKIKCTPPYFAIYHDKSYKEGDVDVEVVMCVDDLLTDKDGFTFREIEAIPSMTSVMVVGPFENLAPAYNALGKWIEESEYEPCGNARQVCHKGPWNESNPENYLTEIQMPVKTVK